MKLVLVAMLLFTSCATWQANTSKAPSQFCEGYQAGYKDGVCYKKINCLPSTALCPPPNFDDVRDHQGGYKRGFLEGQRR